MPDTEEIVINTSPMIALVSALGDLELLQITGSVCRHAHRHWQGQGRGRIIVENRVQVGAYVTG